MMSEDTKVETDSVVSSDAEMNIDHSEHSNIPGHEPQQSIETEGTSELELESSEVLDPELGPDADAGTQAEALIRLATEAESLRLQVEERTGQCVRIAADFDNFRKRTEREKSELELRVKRDAIGELLPVIDSFERARTQIKPQTDQEVNIHKSYQGVYKQLVDGLKRVGVSPMRVEGQPFDPNFHDAIMREPTDQHPEGTVIEELRRGYLLGELVLRHALVKVASAPDGSSTSAAAEDSPLESPEEHGG